LSRRQDATAAATASAAPFGPCAIHARIIIGFSSGSSRPGQDGFRPDAAMRGFNAERPRDRDRWNEAGALPGRSGSRREYCPQGQ